MSLASDYFILYHGLPHSQEDHIEIDKSMDDSSFFELSSLLFSVRRKDFDKMVRLKQFNHICKRFTSEQIMHLDDLYHLQYSLIHHFLSHRSQSNLDHLHNSFSYLLEEGVIFKEAHEKLISLFDPSVFKEEDLEVSAEIIDQDFHSQKQEMILALNELKPLFNSDESLVDINSYLNAQKFSIGVTGVMNAGKSTMLNALMGKELLGTSVVPETANLTLIKYAAKPSAKVIYWNRSQWKRIEQSAVEIKAMASFVKETQVHFKDELESYLLEESRVDDIKVESLSEYTSATQSSKRCNLVRQVELGSDLHFLQEGIEIVDTPGLDDIVIQREEITKEYLSRCDLMIHLMNVSQSATLKDIAFIIDALLYQNITKILIVITRVDTVSPKDVQEVIKYTKASISSQLHALNEDSKLDFILKSLHFVALSGKMALLHRTGKADEAIEAGYSLEDSGITEIEAYLTETLFSKESQKSTLIMHSAKSRLSKAVSSELDSLNYELTILSKSEDELQEELERLKIIKSSEMIRFASLKEQISAYEDELSAYLDAQSILLDKELSKLQGIIRQRLLDDTRYALENEKKIPQNSRYRVIIEKALRHGLIEIIREYRHRFVQRSTKVEEALVSQYKDIFNKSKGSEPHLGEGFEKGFLTSNNEVLINRLIKVLSHCSLKTLQKADQEMISVLKEEFVNLEELIKKRATEISKDILESFFNTLKASIEALSKKLEADESLLQEHLYSIAEDESSRSQKSLALHKRIKMIKTIAKRCQL